MKNLALIATVLLIVVFLVMFVGIINWIGFGLLGHVNISGNTTIAPNEIAAQTVPTIINGITTSTNVIIAFSTAFSGILIRYVFKDDNREREVVIVILSVFPVPLIFEFFAFITLAGGQGLFEIALRLAFVSFLYSLFALICIFIFATYRFYEKGKKSNFKKEKEPVITEPDKTVSENKNVKTIQLDNNFYRSAVKDLLDKAKEKKFFWKGLLYGVLLGIVGNMFASSCLEVFKDLILWQFDNLFLLNIIALVFSSIVVGISASMMWRSITRMDDFLKFVEKTLKKYHLDSEFMTT